MSWPRVDEVVADMAQPRLGLFAQRRARQLDGGARHFRFAALAAPRQRLDRVAIAVAAAEVHAWINSRRIRAQRLLDQAHVLDELAPVDRRKHAQAADAVADRDLVGGLLLRLLLHQVLDAVARFGQPLLDPGQRQRQRHALPLQLAREFGDEGTAHRWFGARHVGDLEHDLARFVLGHVHHAAGPVRGQRAVVALGNHPCGNAAQVLDQRQAQHDRHGPQLAQAQRRD
jgi:hypothetical protein